MDRNEARQLVKAIKESITSDPGQFNIAIAVNVTGQKIVSHGGTGLHIQATGGGPGSTTVGQQVSVDGSHIEIGRQHGLAAMGQQLQALADALDTIIVQLEAETPDKSIVSRAYTSLKDTWVPGVITSVLGCVLSRAIGL
jgi:hypothetical protein